MKRLQLHWIGSAMFLAFLSLFLGFDKWIQGALATIALVIIIAWGTNNRKMKLFTGFLRIRLGEKTGNFISFCAITGVFLFVGMCSYVSTKELLATIGDFPSPFSRFILFVFFLATAVFIFSSLDEIAPLFPKKRKKHF